MNVNKMEQLEDLLKTKQEKMGIRTIKLCTLYNVHVPFVKDFIIFKLL